ncbi:MAG: hypothetical protein J6U86_04085 [Clostridia bacterium]|nr:hypothetical protein [Clostridia bacterium]
MKAWKISLICILLTFLCLFTTLGYASFSSSMRVSGTANIEVPEGLFITKIREISSGSLDVKSVSFVEHSTTVSSSLSRSGTSAGTVEYEITVLNNTTHEYAYRGLYYMTSHENNSYISTSNANNKLGIVVSFPNGSLVGPQDTLTFRVKYTVGRSIGRNMTLNTLVNFQFGINVDSVDKAYDIVHHKFLDILNTASTYQQLVDVLDDKFDGDQTWTSNYVGNVGNAVDNDMMTVETLFAGQLTMMVNGKAQKAWVIIKHEDLDGNELTGDDYTVRYNQYGDVTHKGCEMTLYMTVDPLNQANGWAPVYVTVFTCDRDINGNTISKWYQVGSTYQGQANIVGYRGEYGGTGSFVTDNWKSYASAYQVTESYSYSIGADVSIKTLMQTVDQSTITEFQRLLVSAEAMIANQKYAGTGITVVEDAYAKAAAFYTLDANGKAIADQDTRRVWLIPIMQELDHVLTVAQEAIDKVEQGR